MGDFRLPDRGLVFWPVGTGDSTTIVVDDGVIVQVDLRHLEAAEADDDPRVPIVDRLVEQLPTKSKRPYLSVFVLTHPDMDHCQGFEKLLEEVTIGELWFTPRIFEEYKKDLCDDAIHFRSEAMRRVKATIDANGDPGSGNRVRIVGAPSRLEEAEYKRFPEDRLTVPGSVVHTVDGGDMSSVLRVFVHAPFTHEMDGERNDTSLAMQVQLTQNDCTGSALLLGDLAYESVKRIFDYSQEDDLRWDAFLAPHHCSKRVMYHQGPDDQEPVVQKALLTQIAATAEASGVVVSSSDPVPASNSAGDNPPHARAKNRYVEIAPGGFVCTQEHGGKESPSGVVFEFKDGEFGLRTASGGNGGPGGGSVDDAVKHGRGHGAPPSQRVGYGRR